MCVTTAVVDNEVNQSINHEFLEWPKYLKHCQVHYETVYIHKMSDQPNVRI